MNKEDGEALQNTNCFCAPSLLSSPLINALLLHVGI